MVGTNKQMLYCVVGYLIVLPWFAHHNNVNVITVYPLCSFGEGEREGGAKLTYTYLCKPFR